MHVELTFPADAEAEVEGISEKGQKVKLRSVRISPYFWKTNDTPIITFFSTVDDQDNQVKQGLLKLSGATGALQVSDRTKPAARTKYELDKYGDVDKRKDRSTEEEDDEVEDELEEDDYEDDDDDESEA